MVYDILPSENLEYSDIRDTLAANGGTVNNDVASAFKATANINWASKHKPVSLNTNFCQDFDSSAPNYNSQWWTGHDGNCGLTPKLLNHYNQVIDVTDGDMNGWAYLLPRGDSFFPYRLGDFAGYYPDALPIISNFGGADPIYTTSTSFSFDAMTAVQNEKSLTLGDFPFLKDYYFGVLVVKKGATSGWRATSVATVENGIGSPVFPTNILSEGSTYEAYPFLSSAKYQNWSDPDVAATYYSLPGLKKFTFTVKSSDMTIFIRATANPTAKSITVNTVKVTSATGSRKLTNNSIAIREWDKDFLDPIVTGEKWENLPDITATTTGTTVLTNKTYTGLSDAVMKNPKIWVSFDSARYLQYTTALIPVTP